MTRALLAAALVLAASAARPARAGELSLNAEELQIYSPAVTKGERELEWRGFATGGRQTGQALSLGWSPTSWWATEGYAVLHRDPGGPWLGDSVVVENRFALAPAGELWADPGAIAEVELPLHAGDPGAASVHALLEKQAGPLVLTLNLPFEWKFGSNYVPGTGLSYAARAEWLVSEKASPALEAFGEPGVIGNFDPLREQEHLLGPALYGALRGFGRGVLRWSAAPLIGLTPLSPRWTLVTRLELEF
ncbi:MAG: hypothetical protein KGM24_13355 [Elusimicrobia bacterium]|nr:hypothetical protein [Elusimicrobiota bacterium]